MIVVDTPPRVEPEQRPFGWSVRRVVTSPAGPTLVAAGLSVMSILLGWRGTDTAAHFFRVGLVERDGFHVWNNYWFGGHHTPGYSVLFPVLASVIGIWTVAVISAAASALLFDLFLRQATGAPRPWASLWFAVGTVTNIAIGRLPFALGMAIGIGALLAGAHRRLVLAGLLSILCAAASPVTGAFLALIWMAWALSETGRARRSLFALVAWSLLPVLLLSLIYPQGGSFPFRWGALTWCLVVAAAVLVLVEQRAVRIAAVLFAVSAVLAFVIPTPLGGNLSRFGMYAAGPTLLALVPLRRLIIALLVPALLFWQWSPAFDAMFQSGGDESTRQEYYRPLLGFLASVDAEDARVEVVPTQRHWEAAYVAFEFPIARGWERQLDIRFQPMFYESDLSDVDYRAWLMEAGVKYVALADAPLDRSGLQEAELLEQQPWYLRPVWQSDHWRVWEVVNPTGMLDGAAEVVEIDADSIWIDVRAAGDLKVRVRGSAYWVSEPPLCIETTDDDWIELRDVQPGRIHVFIDESDLVSGEDPCNPVGA